MKEFLKRFVDLKMNLGHILTIVSMVGVILGMWRAVEIKAVQTEIKLDLYKQQITEQFKQEKKDRQDRDREISDSLAITSLRLQQVSENQALMTGILQGRGLIDKAKP